MISIVFENFMKQHKLSQNIFGRAFGQKYFRKQGIKLQGVATGKSELKKPCIDCIASHTCCIVAVTQPDKRFDKRQ